MSETIEEPTEAPDPTAEAPEAGAAVAVAVEDGAEAPAEAEAEAEVEVAEESAPAEQPVAVATAAAEASPAGPRQARLYLCERGHRTMVLWSEAPSTCHARPLRSGPECGRPVYHSTELPDQVQKALNPLKASKKASKKK